ncbi:hypothetical protein [Rubellimicrobium arenae]|uniref:hypothetical protein n=1 Tax=Rubellimicrobium arenae TaxID=2817372 RepID=UPI001FEE6EB9|nr:hypothetical protein [Rubellimicrobium arenae]
MLGSTGRSFDYELLEESFAHNASRRPKGGPLYTIHYDTGHDTLAGLNWVDSADPKGVLLRHFTGLAGAGFSNAEKTFEPKDVDPAILSDRIRHPYGQAKPIRLSSNRPTNHESVLHGQRLPPPP